VGSCSSVVVVVVEVVMARRVVGRRRGDGASRGRGGAVGSARMHVALAPRHRRHRTALSIVWISRPRALFAGSQSRRRSERHTLVDSTIARQIAIRA